MEREKLIKKIYEYNKLCQKNKFKRMFLTILFYTIVNLIGSIFFYRCSGKSVPSENLVMFLIISFVFACISYWVNISIFSMIFNKSDREDKTLESMKKQLIEFDKKHDIKNNYEVEDFLLNKHL